YSFLFFYSPAPTRLPHSFPTRRSSDLGAVAAFVEGWPARSLGRGAAEVFLDRLLDRPLHAAAFSGALRFGNAFLLVHGGFVLGADRKSTRLNSSHVAISYAVFCLKKKN